MLQKGADVEPFSSWSSCAELLEAFADSLGERVGASACDDAFAAMVSGLLEGTGCAVLRKGSHEGCSEIVAASGTWERVNLSRILEEAGSDWISALSDVPMLVVRRRGGVCLRAIRRFSHPSGSGVAIPLVCAGQKVGALLVTYESRRGYGSSYLAAAKLLAGGVSIRLVSEWFDKRTRRQGERISRLTSDVERMGILLRKVGDSSRNAESSF
ncbi:hypothetical protein ACFLTM_01895 [Candidatus Bipolaricaulota bacterium]